MVGSNKGSLRFHGLGVDCFAVAAHVASTRPALRVVD
jgi:hypothetical protein